MTGLTTYQYRTNLWSSIIRTDLLHRYGIYPWPGMNYAEDSPVVMRAYAYAGKVEAIDSVVYHYNRMTEHSLSQISFAQKVETMDIVVRRLSEWYREHTELTEEQISGIMLNYKNRVKSDLLVKGTRDIRAWHKYWPEAATDTISRLGSVPRTIFKIGRYLPFVQGMYLDYLDFRSRNA